MKEGLSTVPRHSKPCQTLELSTFCNLPPAEVMPLLDNPTYWVDWLTGEVGHSSDDFFVLTGPSTVAGWNGAKLLVKKAVPHSSSAHKWHWRFDTPEQGVITAKLKLSAVENGLNSNVQLSFRLPPSLQGWYLMEDWSIALNNLKYMVEEGKPGPRLNYESRESPKIHLELTVGRDPSRIYSLLTHKEHMQYLFTKYFEVNVQRHIYSYGWMGDGPSHLVRFRKDQLIQHDWWEETYPMGTVKWLMARGRSVGTTELSLLHIDLDLAREVEPDKTYVAYRHGWIAYLQKLKNYAENGYQTTQGVVRDQRRSLEPKTAHN